MTFDQWDVVVASFPFVEIPVLKNRPVLVLSSARYGSDHRMMIAAMLTTASKRSWPDDVPIADLDEAGLLHPCVIRWKLNTLPLAPDMRRIGGLSNRDRAAVMRAASSVMW